MKDQETQRLYWVWWGMKRRCSDPTSPHYKNYGGRGIAVCERWAKFEHFVLDMGPRPEAGQLDRINNDGGYEPANCRWATRQQNNSNRRNCIFVDIDGKRVTLKEACRQRGLKYRPVHKRVMLRGWDINRALSTPIGKGNSHANYL